MKPYEGRVIEYFDSLREDGKCSVSDVLFYCQNIDEFLKDNSNIHSQKSWVSRFIKHYSTNDGNPVSTGEVSTQSSSSGGDGASDGGGTNCDGGSANSDDAGSNSDGGGANSDDAGTNSDDGGANKGGSDSNDEDGAPRGGGDGVNRDGGSANGGVNDDENDACSGPENMFGDETPSAGRDDEGAAGDEDESEENEDENIGSADENICSGDESVIGDNGNVGSDEGSASSSSENDSEGSLFELDTHVETATCSSTHRFFRKRYPKNEVVVEWSGAGKYVCLFPVDLNSLLPDQLLTETALDYFVHRYMKPTPGIGCMCGTDLYRSIELESRLKKSAMGGEFNWAAYPYVILIVSGVKHYSILVVENAMQNGPTGMFDINSLRGAHDSAYVFNMMKWYLGKERKKYAGIPPMCTWNAGVLNTKPQQSNCVDCGLYVLHYMEKIGNDMLQLKQKSTTTVPSIKEHLATWAPGNFMAGSAAMFRTVMYQKITDAANEAKKRSKLA